MNPEMKIPDSVDKALANLTDKPATAIGTTIADLWYLACGGISAAADRKRLRIAHSLDLLKKELDEKLKKIPEEKLIEPSTQIVLTALQDAQYCVENETLRNMFSNLIAASANEDSANFVHPSFSGIIRQMNTLDAKNAMLFKRRKMFPIVTLSLTKKNGGMNSIYKTIFLGNPEIQDVTKQSMSITFLSRLGLLTIVTDGWMTNDSVYEPFHKLPEYVKLQSLVTNESEFKEVNVGKGYVELNTFGAQFLSVCT